MKDRRSIERVMGAAANVEVDSHREACIVGGIVRSITATGHFKTAYARHAADILIGYGVKAAEDLERAKFVTTDDGDDVALIFADGSTFDGLADRLFPSWKRVTESEMAPVVRKFQAAYESWPNPPEAVAA